MKNPFEVLEVSEAATDTDIKKAYLGKVREYPPDRAPEQFQEIRAAFEIIKTQRDRLKYELFHSEPPDVKVLLRPWLETHRPQRPTEELLMRALAWTLKRPG